jgi:predicted O-linked N-acetylglucosamine transferase (SPINDLY family)
MAPIAEAMRIAVSHHQAGRLAIAEDLYRRILAAEPAHADAWHLWGMIAHAQGRHGEAITRIQHAIALQPPTTVYHSNLGEVYRVAGQLDEAVGCYRRALELRPEWAELHNNLGNVLKSLRRLDAAEACYRRALELRPQLVGACCNLANVLQLQTRSVEAEAWARRALEFQPQSAEAHDRLGNALQGQGRVAESIACYREALRLNPGLSDVRSNYLCGLRYLPETSPADLHAVAVEFDRRFAAPLRDAWPTHDLTPRAGRPLRLGFVSPSFACRPTGYFSVRVLESLDRQRCEVTCYSDRNAADRLTARFQAAATHWRDVFGLSDERLAEQIRVDQIDILFDLTGHAPGNRLFVFARRPAPVQITWIDSVGTTGLAAIDYLLADPYEIPPDAEAFYTERVLRMPRTYVCYDPADDAPSVGPLPALQNGYLTFASFNNPAKIGIATIDLWAQILRRVGDSRLLLKYHGFEEPATRRRYAALFTERGVAEGRVQIEGGAPHGDLLAAYNRVDLALDPIYNGGLTTCEALWMGVPVVTCPGDSFARRHSLSHLSNVGLVETIAPDAAPYVERAAALAGDLPRLAQLRAGLREQMAASPLCDGRQFAADLLDLLEPLRP